MSKSYGATLIGGIAAMAVATTLAFAATTPAKGPNAGAKGSRVTSADVDTIAIADRLAIYGIRSGDAVAIIQAAKMKKSVPTRAGTAAKASTGKGVAGSKSGGYDLSADALLKRAEGMATGNATLTGLIAQARGTKSRGATRGPAVHSDRVLAGDTDTYMVSFKGGEEAAVLVSGDGDTDLDLYIYDENNNEICSDTDETDTMLCRWTPAWTGNFKISIKNYGRVYNAYQMAVN